MSSETPAARSNTALLPDEPHPASGPRRAAVLFILVTVTLDMLAMGMIAPVLPRLVTQFLHGNQTRAAEMYGIFATVWALMQFIFSPLLGSLSDRFGRRPIVLLSNFGLGLDYLVMALAPTLSWLFIGRVISGITSASVPTAMAYIADVTPPAKRSQAFGLISAAFGVGFVLGPALGGILGNISTRLPFYVAGSMSLLNALYGLFILPESLSRERRGRFSWASANPMGSLVLLRPHIELFGLASVIFLGYLAHQVLTSTYVLYADYRYHWSDRTVGLSLAVVGICSAIAGAVLVKPAVKLLGDRNALLLGLVFATAGFAMFGLSQTGLLFWFGIPVMCLWGLSGPTAQSLMTLYVLPDQQGRLQGAVSSIRGLAGLIGPAIFDVRIAIHNYGNAGGRGRREV
ncbi:TCR/Tet family MFS transporter [Alloacidobacterium dinghuense]|uniref:TCR/Tet family MFS transporter n=1 Tax=Alloacidobacterium dinghuense TaxID=2763107 RepID=A0A7G8BNA7_9BACT|nr:TCR/Tet family MFS transporter [Alloacidobacterium dinghuense]QNI34027.1 TCR/Tet family MFS transporter [Alloacidobacterium dinghuense]